MRFRTLRIFWDQNLNLATFGVGEGGLHDDMNMSKKLVLIIIFLSSFHIEFTMKVSSDRLSAQIFQTQK